MQQVYPGKIFSDTEKRSTERVSPHDPRAGMISIDPERHSGTPCFAGTRVPIQDFWDYLAGGDSLDVFLDNYPTVRREQAVKLIELAANRLLEGLPTT